ncbi:MAG: hypothetical protein FWF77_08645 [Defluviitaleaceae bacterium]|nr:hypothetical protein [Defluviitaleaceae bacterium]
MKKLLALVLVLMLAAFAFTACACDEEPTTPVTPPAIDVEDPVVEDPVVEDPVVEDPVVEDPVVEDPIIDEPDNNNNNDEPDNNNNNNDEPDNNNNDEPDNNNNNNDEPDNNNNNNNDEPDEPAPAAGGFPEGFVYHMLHDPVIQGAAAGSALDSSSGLAVSSHEEGSGTTAITVQEAGGQRYLRISGRTHQSDGLALLDSVFDFQDTDAVTVYGRFPQGELDYDEGEWFVAMLNVVGGWDEIVQIDRWGMITDEEIEADNYALYEFRLRRNFGAPRFNLEGMREAGGDEAAIRVQTNRSNSDFDPTDIIITNVTIERP